MGSWQLAHDILPEAESEVSKKIALPACASTLSEAAPVLELPLLPPLLALPLAVLLLPLVLLVPPVDDWLPLPPPPQATTRVTSKALDQNQGLVLVRLKRRKFMAERTGAD